MPFDETLEIEWTHNELTKAKISRNTNSHFSDGQLISHTTQYFDRGALFEIFCILYTDAGEFVFESIRQLEIGTPLILRHFGKFGLEIHIVKNNKHYKTECVLFPTPGYFNFPTLQNYDNSTTISSSITVKVKKGNKEQKRQREDKKYDTSPDTTTIQFNEVNATFTRHFKYLGSYISYNLCNDHDVDIRISTASTSMGVGRI